MRSPFMKLATAFRAFRLCRWHCIDFFRIVRCNRCIANATVPIEQALLHSFVLRLPKELPGVVVECGAYKGSTSAVLSLACRRARRILHVFDSFSGLPQPDEADKEHHLVGQGVVHAYERGAWAATLKETTANIARYGEISSCQFHPGFFDQTLNNFNEPVALAFCDVDLRSSLESCVRFLWPLLLDGAFFFVHEAHHFEIAHLFYDREWWIRNLGCDAPGLVGAGSGIGLGLNSHGFYSSSLGLAIKNPAYVMTSFEYGAEERRQVFA